MQRKEAVFPSIDLTDDRGSTSQLREGASCCRRSCDISNELHTNIRAYIEREAQFLFEQRQEEEEAKRNEVSQKEQDEQISSLRAHNMDFEKRLVSEKQKAIDAEQQLSQFKTSASESLKRQRVEAETDRRKSLESEKRSQVQKASNLQRLRVEAEAIVEGLKAESKKFKEDVEEKKRKF